MSSDTPGHWSDAGDLSALDLADARHPFAIGERERYALGGELGRGGMGSVRMAQDRRLLREVALKRPHPQAGSAASRRLAQEAWITAQLDHLGIVAVHDAGLDEQGRPWYVMRVVRGQTLGRLLKGQPLDARLQRLRALRDACEAMGYAHRRGFVHRDLKPDNIMVGSFGETQVMDWGLARPTPGPAGDSWRRHLPEDLTAQTVEGALLGTPAYLAPEQLDGQPGSPRSDVWSLGVILYEILAGERAFRGPDSQSVLVQVRAAMLPDLPALPEQLAPLVSLLARATAADPAARFADAKDLADELTRFLEGRRVHTHRYSSAELLRETLAAWWAPIGVVAVGLLVAAGVAGSALLDARAEAERATLAESQADENLRLALISQARTASRAGDRGRAETLAAHALLVGEDPVARGILLDARPRPTLIHQAPAPTCGAVDVDGSGRWAACLQGEELSLWDLDSASQVWTQRVSNPGRPRVDANGWVVATSGDRHQLLDARGHLLQATQGNGSPIWRVGASTLWVAKQGLLSVGSSGSVETLHACAQGAAGAITADAERVVGVCFGQVFVLEDQGVRSFPTLPVSAELGFPQLVVVDGDLMVWATQNGHLVAHDLDTGAHLWTVELDVGSVQDLVADQGLVGVLGARLGVHVLDAASGAVRWVLPQAEGARDLGLDQGRVRIVGDQVQTWTLPEALPERLSGGVTSLDFDPSGDRLAIGHGPGASVLVAGHAPVELEAEPFPSTVKSVDVLPDGRLLVGLSTESRIYDAQLQVEQAWAIGARRTVWLQGDLVLRAAYAQTGPDLASLAPGVTPAILRQPDRPVADIDALSDGSQVVWANADGVWWMDAGALEPELALPLPDAVLAALSADAVLGGTRTRIQVADRDGVPLWSLEDRSGRFLNARFSEDGRTLAVSCDDGRVLVLDADTGALRAVLEGHLEQAPGLAFHPDGGTLVTGSWDRTLRTWDLDLLDAPAQDLVDQVHAAWQLELEDALR
jgi:outer membrane protein assembly factor BamB